MSLLVCVNREIGIRQVYFFFEKRTDYLVNPKKNTNFAAVL